MSTTFDSYCGLNCSNCEYQITHNCGGCIASNGNPFHGTCEVAECAKTHGKRFCGECEHIPCEILSKYSYDNEQGDNGARITRCQTIKNQLVQEAKDGLDPVSCCGHHCEYCFLGQWCGGCRSNYNCCSYATLFGDNLCPNVKCAKEKKLNGCYECENLMDCIKGYFENKNEYIAKAAALFIKKYGKDIYTKALKNAIDAGVNYPKTFDETGSVEKAMAILEYYDKNLVGRNL